LLVVLMTVIVLIILLIILLLLHTGEETQVNIMGNVNEPFMNTNRFEVSFSSNMGVFRLELTITGLFVYKCLAPCCILIFIIIVFCIS